MRILASFLDRIKLLGLAKGTTLAAEATVTTIDADHNALDVNVPGTLPLPSGAATSALQTSGNSTLTNILARVNDVATGTKQDVGNASLASILAKIIAAPSTAANQDLILTAINSLLLRIPTPLGQTTAALSLAVAQARAIGLSLATVATTGEVVKATAGAIYWCSFTQTTGSTVYVQVHDLAAGPVPATRRPEWVSSGTFVSGTSSQSLPIGHTTEGAVCNDGIVIVLSTTQYTFTAPAGNTAVMRVIYR